MGPLNTAIGVRGAAFRTTDGTPLFVPFNHVHRPKRIVRYTGTTTQVVTENTLTTLLEFPILRQRVEADNAGCVTGSGTHDDRESGLQRFVSFPPNRICFEVSTSAFQRNATHALCASGPTA